MQRSCNNVRSRYNSHIRFSRLFLDSYVFTAIIKALVYFSASYISQLKFIACYRCGGGVGVFIFAKKSGVLLLSGRQGCHYDSVYVDAFGEADNDLTRHKPLHLHAHRLAKLHSLLTSHAILPRIIKSASNSMRHQNWSMF
jgi:hypothetical protein